MLTVMKIYGVWSIRRITVNPPRGAILPLIIRILLGLNCITTTTMRCTLRKRKMKMTKKISHMPMLTDPPRLHSILLHLHPPPSDGLLSETTLPLRSTPTQIFRNHLWTLMGEYTTLNFERLTLRLLPMLFELEQRPTPSVPQPRIRPCTLPTPRPFSRLPR